MPKRAEVTQSERAYIEKRLQPIIAALKKDEKLQEQFLFFVHSRGGSIPLTLARLKTVWWPSRKSMYPGFFVLALVDFGLGNGIYPMPKRAARLAKKYVGA